MPQWIAKQTTTYKGIKIRKGKTVDCHLLPELINRCLVKKRVK